MWLLNNHLPDEKKLLSNQSAKGNIARSNWSFWTTGQNTILHNSMYDSRNLRTTLAIRTHTGENLLQVSTGQDKKRFTKWVRPPSQRGQDERRIGWKNLFLDNWFELIPQKRSKVLHSLIYSEFFVNKTNQLFFCWVLDKNNFFQRQHELIWAYFILNF